MFALPESCLLYTSADKYGIKPGDTIKLDAQYEKKTYKFKVKGTYDKSQSIAVFMPIEYFVDTFDFADGRFSGFLSDTKIKDIDESNIATTITIRDITKMADQLDHSMGSYMQYFPVSYTHLLIQNADNSSRAY